MNSSSHPQQNQNPNHAPRHDEIALSAYDLWTEWGQPEGRDEAIWLEAEYRLAASQRMPDVTAVILATLSQPVTRRGAKVPSASGRRN